MTSNPDRILFDADDVIRLVAISLAALICIIMLLHPEKSHAKVKSLVISGKLVTKSVTCDIINNEPENCVLNAGQTVTTNTREWFDLYRGNVENGDE
jgi:hypothetical protein